MDKQDFGKARAKFQNAGLLDHPNVLSVSKWCETPDNLWLVMELCPGGDFATLLAEDIRLKEDVVHSFALDIAAGLLHCHARGSVLPARPASFCSAARLPAPPARA